MIRFPVFEDLRVEGYGLFPGKEAENGGLSAEFLPGLTLVLGANGLGKTTLVWILYRLLAGPFDIPGLDKEGALGRRRLEARRIRPADRKIFARRVADDAATSTARLGFMIGEHRVLVERHLGTLELLRFEVDGDERPVDEVSSYQSSIADMTGVWSFGDLILLLRYLTFYFEDRRELVWDSSAQVQMLRLLFLPAETAQEWTERERAILKADSRVRNLRNALGREEQALADEEDLLEGATDIREQLRAFIELQKADEKEQDELDETALELDADRKAARLKHLHAEQEREQAFREFEHAKLQALEARFPTASDTARYLLSHLLAESECLACGSEAEAASKELEHRLSSEECVVCGQPVGEPDSRGNGPAKLADARLTRKQTSLSEVDEAVIEAREEMHRANAEHAAAAARLEELDALITQRSARIDALIRKLPKEEADLHEQRKDLARMRSRVKKLKEELEEDRAEFAEFVEKANVAIFEHADVIKKLFETYGRDFLIEECSLVWSLKKERVGQEGIKMDFPAFALDLASASFASPVRREGPEQVSESQREFIDLAFRMAIMGAADPGGSGTLVVDAPESSLDAVFVHRAAEVLGRFSQVEQGNRLVVTSNLTDGDLVPYLLARFDEEDSIARTVDLFEIAEPTAAIRELSDEYAAVKERVLKEAEERRAQDA